MTRAGTLQAASRRCSGFALLAVVSCPALFGTGLPDGSGLVTILTNPGRSVNVVVPSRDLGAAVDGMQMGDVAKVYTPANLKAMRSVGFGPLTYRLRTELAGEAWHWNPKGRWSDSTHAQGYWISDTKPAAPIRISNGYRLPRRGNTIDQANNGGYSRLDDGDEFTFWKSNPYLDRHFTGEDNARHPQWVVMDLGEPKPINAMRIAWGVPYATAFRVEYWSETIAASGNGIDSTYSDRAWKAFPGGVLTGKGGRPLLRLCNAPIVARIIRISMAAASGKAPKGSRDTRDGLGYAIQEIYAGVLGKAGTLEDVVSHTHSRTRQTMMVVSSTDPWHRAADLDPRVEQPGFDLVMQSGLTNKRPMLTPVALLYDTPENAAAEVRYLKARGYPLTHIELGEEPDGQYVTPEDYGALYVQWAAALHKADAKLVLGGPSLQTDIHGWGAWPNEQGDRSWVRRFMAYLAARKHATDLGFVSFEWYPFDDVCAPTGPQLAAEPGLLGDSLRRLWREGLPKSTPIFITEYGYSSFAARAEVDIEGALLNADVLGQFFALGGRRAYFYGYEPNTLIRESAKCDTWGNLTLFLRDGERGGLAPVAACRGAEMVLKDWLRGADKDHAIEVAGTDIRNDKGQALVTAYCQRDPDGKRAVLLINKDPNRAWNVSIRLMDAETGDVAGWRKPVELVQLSGEQYVWKPNGEKGRAAVNLPPKRSYVLRAPGDGYRLPAYSLTVLRER